MNNTSPPRPPLNVALICEYIGVASALTAESPDADYGRARALALRCMVELPLSAWVRITRCITAPDNRLTIEFIAELRGEDWPDEPLPMELVAWHAPGIGRQASPPAAAPPLRKVRRNFIHRVLLAFAAAHST